jgi:CTP:phosphocholine cytidylyltransferase-like protein
MLLESPLTEKLGDNNIELASIVTALSEFEKYQTCVENYYIIKDNIVIRRPEFSEEEAAAKYQSEKAYHWNAFWNIVKLGIEGWGANAEL